MNDSYDCIVIGGGPGGCSTAALLAESGVSTLLVEREKLPRFHVGESLMPEVYWPLERLGVLDQMKNSKFVKKFSVAFVNDSGKQSQPFFFKEHDPRECSQTWQVERADFDKMLWDNAAKRGADCVDECRVLEVLFDGEQATGVRLQPAAAAPRVVRCRVVVDASGQQALIANRLKIKNDDPRLKKAAIWGYYKNAVRDEGEHGGATIIMHTRDKESWFWFIPLSDNITSIGVVGDRDYLLKDRGKPAEVFAEELHKCHVLEERLANATFQGTYHVAKEFSYSTSRQAGDGWVLVGDAFGFIDPIYSSGVFFALKSGQMAADAILEGLRNNDTSARQLGSWCDEFKSGTQWIRKLVAAYYTNEFSFGRFMKEHPQYKGNLTDLLIGRIFHEDAGRIFDDMDPALEMARKQ